MKKLSIVALVIISLIVIAGCSSSTETSEKPPVPGDKKPQAASTYLPDDTSPEDYLKRYYTFYAEKKYKEAYKMLPGDKKASQTFEEYEQMHKSMPIESFDVGTKSEQGDTTSIDVKLKIEKFGEWNVAWTFVKDKKGIIAEDYSASSSDTSGSGSDSTDSSDDSGSDSTDSSDDSDEASPH